MTEAANTVATVHGSQLDWWNPVDDQGQSIVDDAEGNDLLRDEALLDLVGVPFMGFNVTFREGVQRKGSAWRDDYVSLELRVAPPEVIARDLPRIQARRKSFKVPELTTDQLLWLPGEQLVQNDGSTGVYRQIVQYLAAKLLITLPEGSEQGEKGESIFDLPRSQWLTGIEEATDGIEIRLRCARGLRYSDYSNEYTGSETARTWYIA